jgi:hypothetical protein
VTKHLGEEGPDLLNQVWKQLSHELLDRYARLESLAGDVFGETLSPSSALLAGALQDAAPTGT